MKSRLEKIVGVGIIAALATILSGGSSMIGWLSAQTMAREKMPPMRRSEDEAQLARDVVQPSCRCGIRDRSRDSVVRS